ncbi:Ap-3 complex subunit delta, partial [Globisporangium splendens]
MFEKNLQDLVKGIRSAKGDVNVYISQCMQEIKNELKSTDQFVKAQAIRKLTYLHMLGYDMCWAAFHVVEVMSYERFSHKRIGYTAASQSFTQSTDVVLLCTNLLKKEFGSFNEYEIGLAINVLANIVTTDLARDLLGDVVAMMNSPKSYVRKKSTLVLYKMFLRYPQGLRLTFDKLKERMEEPDVSVVSCAVNVICELANKKPKNYLGLAPQFFRLLTTSSNNWMLIKVVKLLASLVPEEPRLARKLLDPLATVIQNTPAKSLLYECISTVTTALLYTKKSDGSQPRNVAAIVRLCNDHLRRYIEDPDQNLRYLGLVGLSNLMQSHPYVIAEHQELIVECLAVDDITIRMRSLELLAGMVNPDNAAQIIRELMRQTLSADGAYRHELIARILHVCSINKYENIHDFDWYIHVLVQLARVPGISVNAGIEATSLSSSSSSNSAKVGSYENTRTRSHGIEVARQLLDIAVRVKSVRSVMVENMIDLFMEKDALSGPGASTLSEVYYAAAWITGEYVMEYLEDIDDEDEDDEEDEERDSEEEKLARIEDLVDEMLQPRTTSLPAHVQTVYIQTLLKFVAAVGEKSDDDAVERLAEIIVERLPAFVQSEHIEVQERAVSVQQILLALGIGLSALSTEERASRAFDSNPSLNASTRLDILNSYFTERLAPVGAKAQRKVPLPADLDLDEPLSSLEASFLESGGDVSGFANEDDLEVSFVHQSGSGYNNHSSSFGNSASYSGFDGSSPRKHGGRHRKGSYESSSSSESEESADNKDELERQYALEKERLRKDPFYLPGNANHGNGPTDHSGFAGIMDALDTKKKKKKGEKKSKKSRAILEDELMPDGARSSDEDRRRSKNKKSGMSFNDDEDLSAIDLSVPLGENEKIPDEHLYHRQVKMDVDDDNRKSKKSSSKSKKSKSKSKSKSSRDEGEHKSSKKPSKSSRHHGDDSKERKKKSVKESKENVYDNASSDDDRHHSSTKKKSSSSRHHDDAAGSSKKSSRSSSSKHDTKEKSSSSSSRSKKEKRSSKDKHATKQEQDEPLLLF